MKSEQSRHLSTRGEILKRSAILLVFASCVLLCCVSDARSQTPRVFSLNPAVLEQTKAAVRGGEERFSNALRKLRRDADKAMALGPFSITEKEQFPPSGDKHEYMSLSRYWWPDPSKPDGLPYIRRDGETNPEAAAIPDHENLGKMASRCDFASAYHHQQPYERAAVLFRLF
jgi:hypothetical protein